MTPAERRQILDQIRAAVQASSLAPSEIARRAGIDKGALSRFIGGAGLSIESIEKLAPVVGLELILRPKKK